MLADDFSAELAEEPTYNVPMTAAQERKHSFVDEEVALVDEDALELDALAMTDEYAAAGDEESFSSGALEDVVLAEDLPDNEFIDERDLSTRDSEALVEADLDAVANDVGNIVAEDDVADARPVQLSVAPPAVAVAAVAEADTEEASVDEEIVEIFVEEIGEVMSHLDEYFPQWVANQQDEAALKEFRRGFHTLKGSGRMVGAKYVGELAWSIENMLNRVIDKTIEPTPVLVDLIKTVQSIVPAMVEAFAQRRKPPYVVESLAECANAFARGEKPAAVPALQLRGAPAPVILAEPVEEPVITVVDEVLLEEEIAGIPVADVEEAVAFDHAQVDEYLAAPESVPDAELAGGDFVVEEIADPAVTGDELPEDVAPEALFAGDADSYALPVAEFAEDAVPDVAVPDVDPVLMDVFSAESAQHLAAVDAWLDGLDADLHFHAITDELLRAMHTLKGSARMAGIMPVADIAGPTEKFCKDLRNNGEMADTDVVALVREAASLIRLRVQHLLPDPYAPIPGAQSFLEMLDAIQSSRTAERNTSEPERPLVCAVQPRPGLINDLLAEGLDHVLDGGDYAAQWSQQGVVASDLDLLREELRRLAAAADRAGIPPLADIAQRLRRIYNGIHAGQVMLAHQVLGALQDGHEAIIAMMDCMAAHQSIWPATEVEAALDAVSAGLPPIDAAGLPVEDMGEDVDAFSAEEFSAEDVAAAEAEVMEKSGTFDPVDDFADVELTAADIELSTDEVIMETGSVEPLDDDAVEMALEPLAEEIKAEAIVEEELTSAQDAREEVTLVDEATLALADEAEQVEVMPPVFVAPEPVAASAQFHPVSPAVTHAPAAADEDEDEIPDRDPELVEIFLEEASEIVESAGESLETWLGNVSDTIEVQKLQRDLHTLKGGARMAEIPELGDLAHELENLYEGLSHGTLTAQPALFALLNRCHDRIADMVQDIRARGRCKKGNDLIALIQSYIKDPINFTDEVPAVVTRPVSVETIHPDQAPQHSEPMPAAAIPAAAAPQEFPAAVAAVSAPAEEPLPTVDADILEIFIEEAADLTAELDEALTGWQSEPTNMMHADQLKRVLHTLKGGARLAGLKRLGDVSHDFETRVIELGPRAPDAAFFASMMSFYDEISSQVDRVRAGGAAAAVAANLEAVAKASAAAAAAAPVVVAPVVAEAPAVARSACRAATGSTRGTGWCRCPRRWCRLSRRRRSVMRRLLSIAGRQARRPRGRHSRRRW
jgi:chemosensory pili system protein ChpA (sensor histidine kinase/response regulator)